ncbi:unnamed protein product [Calypogeia fissa]
MMQTVHRRKSVMFRVTFAARNLHQISKFLESLRRKCTALEAQPIRSPDLSETAYIDKHDIESKYEEQCALECS